MMILYCLFMLPSFLYPVKNAVGIGGYFPLNIIGNPNADFLISGVDISYERAFKDKLSIKLSFINDFHTEKSLELYGKYFAGLQAGARFYPVGQGFNSIFAGGGVAVTTDLNELSPSLIIETGGKYIIESLGNIYIEPSILLPLIFYESGVKSDGIRICLRTGFAF